MDATLDKKRVTDEEAGQMTEQDGTPVTVYVDKQFAGVSVQTGMPAPPQQPQA